MYKVLFITIYLSFNLRAANSQKCPKSLKKSLIKYKSEAPRKPIPQSQNSTCNHQSTCCTLNMELEVREKNVFKVKEALVKEIGSVRMLLQSIQAMTAGKINDMINKLVPSEIAAFLDIDRISELVWSYSLGEINSYELIVEVAVVGKDLLFNENASQKLKDMVECVIRELADHAHEAFGIIAEVAEELLEAPRTFGKGFTTVEVLFTSLENAKVSRNCKASQVYGCHTCGVRLPPICYSTCYKTTKDCLEDVANMGKSLWNIWVNSISKLVDAMLLLQDIEIDPNELLDEDMVNNLLLKIQMSMMKADVKKCLPYKARMRRSLKRTSNTRIKRKVSESAIFKRMLINRFSNTIKDNCKYISVSDKNCWLEDSDYDSDYKKDTNATREAKSNTEFSDVAAAINSYKELVDEVSKRINDKVKRKRKYDY